jgi:hypothetical protein
MVLNIQTNKKGLSAPNQLTKEKLKIRINTPSISIFLMCWLMKEFNRVMFI